MKSLPSFVALRTYGTENQFVVCDTEGSKRGRFYVSNEAELVVSPKARFAVVPSTKHTGLIHIRCCYTNKYWCSETQGSNILAAVASEPVEDISVWNCTLFSLQFYDKYVMLYHRQSNFGVYISPIDPQYKRVVLCTMKCGFGQEQYFLPMDTSYIVRLPKRVTFKDNNGRLLCAGWKERHQYHQFSQTDYIDDRAVYEIFYTGDGDIIRVKSLYFGKFWRRSPNWIWADSDHTTSNNRDTLFQLVSLGENVIGLRNKGNNNYCIGLTTEGKRNCLNARVGSIVNEARLFVGEPVLSRTIKVHFRLKDALLRGQEPLEASCTTAPNRTMERHEIQLGFEYTKTKTGSWNTTITMKASAKGNIESKIPFIANGKIDFSAEVSAVAQFGETVTTSKKIMCSYKVPVPAMTKAVVKVLATKATYDIPFSYTQTDTYYSGERVSTDFEDGLYQGVESCDFYYDTKYEPLS